MALSAQAINDISMGRGGSYGLSRDVIKHNLWDTRFFGTTRTDYTFFSTPIGTTWFLNAQKTKNETNMLDSGKLPNGQTFLVKRIGVALILLGNKATASEDRVELVQDFYDIMQHSVFEIRIAGREYDFQVHGRQFIPSVAAAGGATAATANTRAGDIVASGWISLDHIPIFIDQLVTFSVNMALGSAVDSINTNLDAACSSLYGNYSTVQVCLEGVLTRAK